MEENQFWFGVWRIIATAVVLIIACFSGCTALTNIKDNNAIVAMVEKGADPIKAKCAIRPDDRGIVCGIAVTK